MKRYPRLAVGDRVEWTSTASGVTWTKVGVVAEVVPPWVPGVNEAGRPKSISAKAKGPPAAAVSRRDRAITIWRSLLLEGGSLPESLCDRLAREGVDRMIAAGVL